MKSVISGVPKHEVSEYKGLIVSANSSQFVTINLKGKDAILNGTPILSLSCQENDKSAYGIVSHQQNTDNDMVNVDTTGSSAIWVLNRDGTFEPGDIIRSSGVPGYGTKQRSDCVTNYSFAKINMKCDFSPIVSVKKVMYHNKDGSPQTDKYGELHWTDTTELEYAYDLRYLDLDGVTITKEEYEIVDGYIAALVACTLF